MIRVAFCLMLLSLTACVSFQPSDTTLSTTQFLYEIPVEEVTIEEEEKREKPKKEETITKEHLPSKAYLFKIEIPIGKKTLRIEW